MGKVAIFHVVVANGTHFVYIAKAAVVVGQHKAIATNEFACAASTKDADAFA